MTLTVLLVFHFSRLLIWASRPGRWSWEGDKSTGERILEGKSMRRVMLRCLAPRVFYSVQKCNGY